ncbi:MAG: hypothetical protein AABX86_00365 [Nanoarchaeota archaeon]
MDELSEGCQVILRRMLNRDIIGGKHLPERICLSWIKYLPKELHKKAMRDWELCSKNRVVMTKPKPSDRHVFLNPRRLEEIKKLVE